MHLNKPLAVFAVLSVTAAPALADKPKFGDTLSFGLGGMNHNANVVIQSTRDGRDPVKLDFDDIGMDQDASTVWMGVDWQFADSWGLNFSYSSFDGDGLIETTEGGNFGDIEWTADAELTSNFDLELYILDVHWDFINTGQTHLGVGLGLHVADIKMGLEFSLDGSVGGQIIEIDSGSETAAVTAPLPNVSLRVGHTFGNDKFYIGGTAGYFGLTVDDIDGELITARAVLEWRAFKNFGFGAGYQYVDINVEEDKSDRVNDIDAEFYGPILFVSAAF